MKNIAEFRIIGRVGNIEARDKVTHIDVAANYGRKVNGEWEDDTHWNRVTVFGTNIARAAKMNKGDLVHITGRVRQTRYDRDGSTVYSVDLVADALAVLASNGKPDDSRHDEDAD